MWHIILDAIPKDREIVLAVSTRWNFLAATAMMVAG
jgi:hypothetical protein